MRPDATFLSTLKAGDTMATEADLDLNRLSASQQESLQQYTDVTGQEIKDAIPLLERSQWNVQVRSLLSHLEKTRLTRATDCNCKVL